MATILTSGAGSVTFLRAGNPQRSSATCDCGSAQARTGLQDSGGLFFCDGTFAFDFKAEIQSGSLPQLVPGALVAAQYWFRDPLDPVGIGLSNALQFVVQP